MVSFPLACMRIVVVATSIAILAVPAAAQEPCDCETQRPEALAVVNGIKILTADVERQASPLTTQLRALMDATRAQALQNLIEGRLVEVEAKRRGVSVSELMRSEVFSKVEEPIEEELRVFYERNRGSLQGTYEENRERLLAYFRGQRQEVQMTLLRGELRRSATITVLDPAPKPPASQADLARVLASVNGSNVLLGELEESLKAITYEYRSKVFEVEKRVLDEMIDDVLIAQEASRRGTTPQALVESEIAPKARKVDVFEASKFYNENKGQMGGQSFAAVKDDLMAMMRVSAIAEAKHVFAEALRQRADVKIALVEPAAPTYAVDVPGRPAKGPASAPVTVVEFSDFQCPQCARVFAQLEEVLKPYAGKVRVVARHFPLEQHPQAFKAAEAAEAAAEQGRFWEYAALLYANQADLSVSKLKDLATQAGLDRKRFDAALDSGKFAEVVQKEFDDAVRIGVAGTPAFYVNGRLVSGSTAEAIKAAIDAALGGK